MRRRSWHHFVFGSVWKLSQCLKTPQVEAGPSVGSHLDIWHHQEGPDLTPGDLLNLNIALHCLHTARLSRHSEHYSNVSGDVRPLTDLKRFQTFLLLPLEKKQQAAKKKAAKKPSTRSWTSCVREQTTSSQALRRSSLSPRLHLQQKVNASREINRGGAWGRGLLHIGSVVTLSHWGSLDNHGITQWTAVNVRWCHVR